jgi:hypothetical protein
VNEGPTAAQAETKCMLAPCVFTTAVWAASQYCTWKVTGFILPKDLSAATETDIGSAF